MRKIVAMTMAVIALLMCAAMLPRGLDADVAQSRDGDDAGSIGGPAAAKDHIGVPLSGPQGDGAYRAARSAVRSVAMVRAARRPLGLVTDVVCQVTAPRAINSLRVALDECVLTALLSHPLLLSLTHIPSLATCGR